MNVTVAIPPSPVVSWEEADRALVLDGDEDQREYVEGLIAAATAWIDGPAGWLGRAIGSQTLEARFEEFDGREIFLPYGPVSAIVDVNYLDATGAEQTFSSGNYSLVGGNTLRLSNDAAWPGLYRDPEAARVTYVAGYDDVPPQIKQAILLLVGQWFRNRENAITGTIVSTMPMSVEALLSTFRSWR